MKALLLLLAVLAVLFAPSLVLAAVVAVVSQPVTIAFTLGLLARPAIARRMRGWVA